MNPDGATGAASNPSLRAQFLDGMSQAAATVSIVTTDGPAGRAGVTVSAMASVSADTPKPTLLVCVHEKSPAAAAILANGAFCVNVLRDDQAPISDTFAGRRPTADGDKFSAAGWTAMTTGAPRLVDPLAAFDCRVASGERVGTHHVFIGAVEAIFVAKSGSPLIYAHRAYGAPTALIPTASDAAPDAAALKLACFHTFGPFIAPPVCARLAAEDRPIALDLTEGDHRRVLEALTSGAAELAILYDLELPETLETERVGALAPYVALPEGHPLAARDEIPLAALASEPLALLASPPSGRYFLGLFEAAGLTPIVRYRLSAFEMVRGMVAHGLAYSLLATKPAGAMSYDGKAIVTRPLSDAVAPSPIALAWRRGQVLSPNAAAFAEGCRALFAEALFPEALVPETLFPDPRFKPLS